MPAADKPTGLAAVAFDPALGSERRLRVVPGIESWEVHSELALVCPSVRERARELLPERDPDAFPSRRRAPISLPSNTADWPPDPESLPLAVLGYMLWRLADTARAALLALGTVVVLALLAQLLH
jgi:hypothetical protein